MWSAENILHSFRENIKLSLFIIYIWRICYTLSSCTLSLIGGRSTPCTAYFSHSKCRSKGRCVFVSVKCSWGYYLTLRDVNFEPDCKALLNLGLHLLERRFVLIFVETQITWWMDVAVLRDINFYLQNTYDTIYPDWFSFVNEIFKVFSYRGK